jgi:hypothetical protein
MRKFWLLTLVSFAFIAACSSASKEEPLPGFSDIDGAAFEVVDGQGDDTPGDGKTPPDGQGLDQLGDQVAGDALDAETLADDVGPDADSHGPECDPGEGCFLDKCTKNETCISRWCLEHMGEGVCSMDCEDDCAPGWTCRQVSSGGADFVSICVSDYSSLCKPCVNSDDCEAITGDKIPCVDFGSIGRFCGGACGAGDKCPSGYVCEASVSVEGISSKQCVPLSGECRCTNKSVANSLYTICSSEENQWGVCSGKRVCQEGGLGDCTATVAAPEVCDGVDQDCDGTTDNDYLDGETWVTICDDQEPCTLDLCNNSGECVNVAQSDKVCDDQNPCTKSDTCNQGLCLGTEMVCNDFNQCTDDFCEGGECKTSFNDAECDDGDPCTGSDRCSGGTCQGSPVACGCSSTQECAGLEDGNVCNGTLICDLGTVPGHCILDPNSVVLCPPPSGPNVECLAAACNPANGLCGLVPAREGLQCQDNDLCDVDDRCQGGICQGNQAANCEDGNDCTDDSCVPATGCVNTNRVGACQDGEVCTDGDFCQEGTCVGGPTIPCEDGNPCTADYCQPGVGCVSGKLSGDACEDGDVCTEGDLCDAGLCTSGAARTCDDLNPCTEDACDPLNGCTHSNLDGIECDDLDLCSRNDRCVVGECLGTTTVVCDDGNDCTQDLCTEAGACNFVDTDGGFCDDGDPCSLNDLCVLGECQADPILCDDLNPCTSAVCDGALGCVFTNTPGMCSDGSACTDGDTCVAGKCVGMTVSCDDSNVCTLDGCDPKVGCLHSDNDGEACDDGDTCTEGDLCAAGKCQGEIFQDCDDTNACTTDVCLLGGGCDHLDLSGTACEDGDACTLGDLCQDGACVSDPMDCDDSNPCTDGACVEGACQFTALDAVPCDDLNACTFDTACVAGQCQGSPLDCDDTQVCTADSCDPTSGCVNDGILGACEDGNLCTEGDTCDAGLCASGAVRVCNDNNDCTEDSCDVALGCQFVPRLGVCDDGDECTDDDTCLDGLCTGAATTVCAPDANPCTEAICDAEYGCIQVPATGACDDANQCTLDDYCSNGFCKGGAAKKCPEDGNPCTDEACDKGMGCIQVSNTVPCDDGDACTTGDTCGTGSCKPGTSVTCQSDGNDCTLEACEALTGCASTKLSGTKCGTQANEYCVAGVCQCVPSCAGKACGDDGCGGTCGTCINDDSCSKVACEAGQCQYTINPYYCMINGFCVGSGLEDPADSCRVCSPLDSQTDWTFEDNLLACGFEKHCWEGTCCSPGANCTGKQCGSDNCGGSCGTCLDAQHLCLEDASCGHPYAAIPYATGFETGAREASWRLETTNAGNVTIALEGTDSHTGTYSLRSQKRNSSSNLSGDTYAQLYLNAAGADNVVLGFWFKAAAESLDSNDSVSLSVDGGANWTAIHYYSRDLTPNNDTWYFQKINLSAAATLSGLTLSAKTVLRFQHRIDGSFQRRASIYLDDLTVGESAYSALPLVTGFEESTNTPPAWISAGGNLRGRARYAGTYVRTGTQSLQLDSANNTDTRAEFRVSADLAGEKAVVLSFWWTDYGDQDDSDDGVFLSVDGGRTQTRIYQFQPASYTNGVWKPVQLSLTQLAATAGLTLSKRTVVALRGRARNALNNSGLAIEDLKLRSAPLYSTIPYSTGFEIAEFDASWMVSSQPLGRQQITGSYSPKEGSYHLVMDRDSGAGTGTTAINEARLHLDLTGKEFVFLDFWWKDLNDDTDEEDGVFLSVDGGTTFLRLVQLKGGPLDAWNRSHIDLVRAATAAGLELGATCVVKFQNKANAQVTNDGLAFDAISVTTEEAVTYQMLPVNQLFPNTSMPNGWAFYSSRNGRIRITSEQPNAHTNPYHLLLDSSVNNWGENQANLHLNLKNTERVLLRYWIKDFGETTNDWDGLWLSDNGGGSFVKVTSPSFEGLTNGVWYNQFFDLDRLAKDNGLTLTDRFVISFRQTDNNVAPNRGYAIDDLRVMEAGWYQPTYANGFETGEMDAYWSCLSTASGRCLVTGQYSPYNGSWHLTMDASTNTDSMNQATLRLDLSRATREVTIQFQIKGFSEDLGPEDGLFISDDGGTSYSRVRGFFEGSPQLPNGYTLQKFNLTTEANYWNLDSRSSTFVVKFQQWGNRGINNDGMAIDEVRVEQVP